jgi:hypothetical protein
MTTRKNRREAIVDRRCEALTTMLDIYVPKDRRGDFGVWLHGWLLGALMEYDGELKISRPPSARARATDER